MDEILSRGSSSSNSLFLRAEFHYLTSYVLLRVARAEAPRGRTPKDIACSLCYPRSSSPRPARTMERVSPGASGSQSLSSLWCRSAPAAVSRAPSAASMGKRCMQMTAVQIGASGCRCQCSHLCRNARPATEQRNRLATVLGGANGCRCRSNRRSLDAKAVATPWQVRRQWQWRKPHRTPGLAQA